jgi:RNA polymerase sigma-70 factor (ECF subfamily)
MDCNADALAHLYDRYNRLVYSLALRILQSHALAEEITSDVFVRIWQKPTTWDPNKGSLITWMLSITRYASIDRLRYERRRPDHQGMELVEEVHVEGDTSTDEIMWTDGPLVRELLKRLPREQVEVLELAFFEGMTHKEMAQYLNLPLGTVKTRVRLGLQKLRAMWMEASTVPER